MYVAPSTVPGVMPPRAPLGLSGCPDCGGLGLFDAGMDWSEWTWQEWATVGVGAYVLFSVFTTSQSAARGVRRRFRRARA